METSSVHNRLDQHEEQIQRLQSDVAEIKTRLQLYRAENAEFRKLMMEWMNEQGEQQVSGFYEFQSAMKIKLLEFSPQGEVVIDPSETMKGAVEEDDEPVPEVPIEVWELESSQLIVEPNISIVETPKQSSASIVMDMKQMGFLFSFGSPGPLKFQSRNQEQQVNKVLPLISATGTANSKMDAVENGIHEEEFDVYAIYIKGLPMTITLDMLGYNELEDENGNSCRFEDIRVRDLPPPEPPDFRLGHHLKASLEDKTFFKARVMIENGKFIYYKGLKCNLVLGLVNK